MGRAVALSAEEADGKEVGRAVALSAKEDAALSVKEADGE